MNAHATVSSPSTAHYVVTAGAAATVGGLAAIGIVALGELDPALQSLALAVPFAVVAAVLAIVRYEWFIVGLIAVRSLLDVFDSGWQSGGMLDPAAAVATLLIATGVMWLLAQWSVGQFAKPAPPTIALWALAFAGLVSVVMATDRAGAMEWNIRLLAGVVMFTVIEQLLVQRPGFVRPLLAAVVMSLVIPAAVATYQQAAGNVQLYDGVARVRSTFAHPSTFATYLVTILLASVALASVLRGGRRFAVCLAAVTAGAALVLTQARGGWAAALVGLVLLGVKLERRILWLLAGGVVAAVVLAPSTVARIQNLTEDRYSGRGNTDSLEWRIEYWSELLDSASGAQRLNGIGLEEVQRTNTAELQPHNVFVQTYVELGTFGIVALVALISTMWIYLVRRARAAEAPFDAGVAWGACAIALALLVQFVSENLLTSVGAHWYAAAAMAYGYTPRSVERSDGRPEERSVGRGVGPRVTGYANSAAARAARLQ